MAAREHCSMLDNSQQQVNSGSNELSVRCEGNVCLKKKHQRERGALRQKCVCGVAWNLWQRVGCWRSAADEVSLYLLTTSLSSSHNAS